MVIASTSLKNDAASPVFSTVTIILLALSALWCALWFAHAWHYWEDDAYIHLEFARSLATGHGFSFNGRVVYGDTSPLWVFLLVAAHAFVPDWMVAGKLLMIAGAIFALAGVYVFSRRVAASASGQWNEAFPAAMVLLLVTNPFFCYWSFSGMEAVTAAGLGCWGAVAATSRRPAWNKFFAGCLLAGTAPLLRPEMIFLTGILSLLLLYHWYQLPRIEFSLPKLGGFAIGCVLAFGPGLGTVCGPHFWPGCPQPKRGKVRGSGQFGGIAAA